MKREFFLEAVAIVISNEGIYVFLGFSVGYEKGRIIAYGVPVIPRQWISSSDVRMPCIWEVRASFLSWSLFCSD
jgi:hypothetical protein